MHRLGTQVGLATDSFWLIGYISAGFGSQSFHQQLRVIRDDSVHSHCGGLEHFARVIHGPGDHGFASGMKLVYQLWGDQSIVSHHMADRQRLPSPQVPIRFGNRAQNQRTIQSVQLAHDAGQERRDEVSALRRKALERLKNHLLHAAHLHLNIKEGLARVEFQHVFQARWLAINGAFCMDLLQCSGAHRDAVELSIMANNGLFVAGAADIKLKAIGAVPEAKVESRDGIFRRIESGAAMSEQ